MLDDLDLAWEEQGDPRRRRGTPPSRQIRQGRRKERKRRRRSFGALFISFVLLAALGGGVYYGVGKLQDIFGAPDYDSVGTTPVNVKIPKDAGATEIGQALYDKKVVESVKAFTKAADKRPPQPQDPTRRLQAVQAHAGLGRAGRPGTAGRRLAAQVTGQHRRDHPRGHHVHGHLRAAVGEDEDPGGRLRGRGQGPDRAGRAGLVVQPGRRQAGRQDARGLPLPGHLRVRPGRDRGRHPQGDGGQLQHRHG